LISQFNQEPFQLQFVKVVFVHCGETFTAPGANAGQIHSVTKHDVSKIESLFITFLNNRKEKIFYIQFYMRDFKLTVEEARNNTYPGGGITLKTWDNHV
jgi:hypothetical protein